MWLAVLALPSVLHYVPHSHCRLPYAMSFLAFPSTLRYVLYSHCPLPYAMSCSCIVLYLTLCPVLALPSTLRYVLFSHCPLPYAMSFTRIALYLTLCPILALPSSLRYVLYSHCPLPYSMSCTRIALYLTLCPVLALPSTLSYVLYSHCPLPYAMSCTRIALYLTLCPIPSHTLLGARRTPSDTFYCENFFNIKYSLDSSLKESVSLFFHLEEKSWRDHTYCIFVTVIQTWVHMLKGQYHGFDGWVVFIMMPLNESATILILGSSIPWILRP